MTNESTPASQLSSTCPKCQGHRKYLVPAEHGFVECSDCSQQPSPARSDMPDTGRKTVWWDRAAGGFYLSYESIPEAHRKAEGRIVKMVAAQGMAESTPSSETIDLDTLEKGWKHALVNGLTPPADPAIVLQLIGLARRATAPAPIGGSIENDPEFRKLLAYTQGWRDGKPVLMAGSLQGEGARGLIAMFDARRAIEAELASRASESAAAPADLALRKLCDQLDGMKRRLRPTPDTGQHHSYLMHEDVEAYVEEARKALATHQPTTQAEGK